MAGEHCSAAACGWCGRCEGWTDDVCNHCGRADCQGDCVEADGNQDQRNDIIEDAA